MRANQCSSITRTNTLGLQVGNNFMNTHERIIHIYINIFAWNIHYIAAELFDGLPIENIS